MIFPKSIAERGEEPINHAQIKSYNDEFLISFKSELEETIRNTVSLLSAIFILFYMVLARDVFVTIENLSPECSKLSEIFDNALIKVLNK